MGCTYSMSICLGAALSAHAAPATAAMRARPQSALASIGKLRPKRARPIEIVLPLLECAQTFSARPTRSKYRGRPVYACVHGAGIRIST